MKAFPFIIYHNLFDLRFYKIYKQLLENNRARFSDKKIVQDYKMRRMINYSYNNISYYKNKFNKIGCKPNDFNTIEDLESLPILTREVIKNNYKDFIPDNNKKIKYYERRTGGSTGEPLKHRISKYDRLLSGAILYRGWGYANYELGDKMIFLGGASLNVGTSTNPFLKIDEFIRNIKKLSSFDMTPNDIQRYAKKINTFNPKFIRGYASSLYYLSKWLDYNSIKVHSPKACFTTAEKLFPQVRKLIEKVFNCEIFDTYGLNDGGVTAFETKGHSGLKIDMERSLMEVVDDNGNQIEDKEGRILATNLENHAMPLLRYDTGDIGIMTTNNLDYDNKYLVKILGRQQEMLQTPEGKFIHGEFFSHIFWNVNGIKQFQIVQNKIDVLDINIVLDDYFDYDQISKIKNYIFKRSKKWEVKVNILDKINQTSAGKHNFVINNIPSQLFNREQ